MLILNSTRLIILGLALNASSIIALDQAPDDQQNQNMIQLTNEHNLSGYKNIKIESDALKFYFDNPLSKKTLIALLAAGVPAMGAALWGALKSNDDDIPTNIGLGVLGFSGFMATIFGGVGLLSFEPNTDPVLTIDKQGLQIRKKQISWDSIKKIKIKTRTERIGRHSNFTYQYIQIRLKNGAIAEIGGGLGAGLPIDQLLDLINVVREKMSPDSTKLLVDQEIPLVSQTLC